MLTSPASTLVRDDRPAYRPYEVTVSRIVDLTPSFRRVTFIAADLATFGTDGLDQRIKLMFPLDSVRGGFSDIGVGGDWYARWRDLADTERNPIRTFTVRAVRQHDRELDIDFVSHGDGGPAARWLTRAVVGDPLVIVGPDARSVSSAVGIDWHPGDATDLLLVGDETAVPAICSIVESLPAGRRATVFLDVPRLADAVELSTDADVTITWLGRDAGPDSLETVVRAWADANHQVLAIAPTVQPLNEVDVDVELLWDAPESTNGRFYAWLAGESSVIKTLRRLLVSEKGLDRTQVAFMGYWRLGRSEAQA